MIGPITLGMKRTGKPGAGDPHAGFDEARAGDVTMGAGLRPRAKAMDEPPDPTVRAPVLDPTGGGGGWKRSRCRLTVTAVANGHLNEPRHKPRTSSAAYPTRRSRTPWPSRWPPAS